MISDDNKTRNIYDIIGILEHDVIKKSIARIVMIYYDVVCIFSASL